MRGFGFSFDTGSIRQWYVGEDGVKRWLYSDEPCSYTAHLEASFAALFGDTTPAPLADTEAAANRDFYLRQSAMTRNGRVPTANEVRASFNPHRQDEAAAPRGALADGAFSSPLKDEQPRRAAP